MKNNAIEQNEFRKWLELMSSTASYSDQRELLRVVLKHYDESLSHQPPTARPTSYEDWRKTLTAEEQAASDKELARLIAEHEKPTPPPQSLVEALEELVKECRGKHYDYKYPASINVSEIEEILAKFKGDTK